MDPHYGNVGTATVSLQEASTATLTCAFTGQIKDTEELKW